MVTKPPPRPAASKAPMLTIGRLAKAAGVGIETVRYYRQRGLLPAPDKRGAFDHYPVSLADRIGFIKRAQELGLSLDEIAQLLRLEDGADRASIRRIAAARLAQIELKLADLRRMQKVLRHLIGQCEHTRSALPCPIIASLRPSATPNPVAPARTARGSR